MNSITLYTSKFSYFFSRTPLYSFFNSVVVRTHNKTLPLENYSFFFFFAFVFQLVDNYYFFVVYYVFQENKNSLVYFALINKFIESLSRKNKTGLREELSSQFVIGVEKCKINNTKKKKKLPPLFGEHKNRKILFGKFFASEF